MAIATYNFPRGFLWGTATSSHQVEGYNTNNQWWAWEQLPGKILNEDKSGAACDWWGGRWREDFDRAKESGQNAHRFSIEWSRVQPAPEIWDESAIDRYREMARGLQQREMTPLVTLHHFTDPLWLVEKGGWENPQVIGWFGSYVRKVVEALQEYVNLWVTINEPNIYATMAHFFGVFPPGEKNLKKTFSVYNNMIEAHAAAYRAIKEVQPTSRVGAAYHVRGFQPARSWSPFDRWMVGLNNKLFNDLFPQAIATGWIKLPFKKEYFEHVKGTQDFIGLNYYTEELVAFYPLRFNLKNPQKTLEDRFYSPGVELSDDNFIGCVPEGLGRALKWCNNFRLPIIITENGINDRTDRLRPRYLVEHLHQVWRSINFNYPIKGYFHWSLVDNFEWERGWSQRFGLWELDTANQKRTKRSSVDLYAEICRLNGISSEIVGNYTPELLPKLFPD